MGLIGTYVVIEYICGLISKWGESMADLRLKELRALNKLTQADVAAHLHIARESYSRYESGEREMTYNALIDLAELFTVSIDYLLGRQEAIPSYLNEDERAVIEQYRTLDKHTQDGIKNTIAFECSRIPKVESGKAM